MRTNLGLSGGKKMIVDIENLSLAQLTRDSVQARGRENLTMLAIRYKISTYSGAGNDDEREAASKAIVAAISAERKRRKEIELDGEKSPT